MNKIPKIIASDFVKRQVKGTAFSYSDYSFEELARLTTTAYMTGHFKKGPRDGVILVQLHPTKFHCSIVPLETASEIQASFNARQEGEKKRLTICASGKTLPAEEVDIVLYSREALMEGNENTDLSADYEIVSINVAPKGGVPMHPHTMARNQLKEKGGTYVKYDSDTWAHSAMYWSEHAMVMPTKVRLKSLLWKIFDIAMFSIGAGVTGAYLFKFLTEHIF